MKFVFAPMEGITGYLYRNVRQKYYPEVTTYYSPFYSPDEFYIGTRKNLKDADPCNNTGITLVPQIMTNRSEYFVRAAAGYRDMGYEEINLNLGCPSGTVFNKHRGSGMLKDPEELDHFLEEIFEGYDGAISVKTRLGVSDPEEFYRLLEIYNKYPLAKLIIHPRVRQEFYKKVPHMDVYREAAALSRAPVCYNGNIFSVSRYRELMDQVPDTTEVMIGRGLVANPGLVGEILTGRKADQTTLKAFMGELYEAYRENCPGQRQLLFKMKEQWYYMGDLFPDAEKQIKKIRKTQKAPEYLELVEELFDCYTMDTTEGFFFI